MPSDYIEEMSKYMSCELTPLSLVKLTQEYRDIMEERVTGENYTMGRSLEDSEFLDQERFIYLGEIPNMPGHVVVVGQNGRVYFGFHDDDFQELSEDEV